MKGKNVANRKTKSKVDGSQTKGVAAPVDRRCSARLSPTCRQAMLLLSVGWQIWQNGFIGVNLVKAEGVGSVKTVRMQRLRTTEFRKLVDRGLIVQTRTIEYARDTTRVFEAA